MKKIVDIVLNDEVVKQDFIDNLDNQKIEVYNLLVEFSNMIVLHVEEDYLETLKKHEQIKSAEPREMLPVPASLPPIFYQTKNLTVVAPSPALRGSDYAPAQMYYDTDIIYSSQTLGKKDQITTLNNANYYSQWTGRNVDIVTLEVGPVNASLQNVHTNHPDFVSADNPAVSRVTAMNWVDLEDTSNRQVSTGRVFSSHGMGVLIAAGGTICGFAKNSNLYAVYLTAEDGEIECYNSILSWHNSKSINPVTGVRNPTIVINEYQYLVDRYIGIKIDEITSIVDENGTVDKPISGWGTDFTPFVNRNIIPWKILDPNNNTWYWCLVFPFQGYSTAMDTAITTLWNAGITVVTAAGNNGGVYVKNNDPRSTGTYCTTSPSGVNVYYISRTGASNATDIFSSTNSSSVWYPFIAYGPHGNAKAIEVAAGQNSETYPLLDAYSNRGPGIDIIGLGANTWTSYPSQTFADGFQWGMFSGTSCATPTVVGKIACMIERYFELNGIYPTPDQIKQIVTSEAKSIAQGTNSTTWNNVPSPSTNYSVNKFVDTTFYVNHIQDNFWSPNGGFRLAELAGTVPKRAFLNVQGFSRINTQGKRPITGRTYPRSSVKRVK